MDYFRKTLLTLFSALLCFSVAPSYGQQGAVIFELGDDFFVIPINRTPTPDAPASLNPSQREDANVQVSWPAVAGADGYRVEWLNPETGRWEEVYVGSGTSFTFTNAPYGVNRFRIRACEGDRCGERSNVVLANVTANSDSGANSVGALQGSGGVNGGASYYQIPIVVPPGRKGVQPDVSLSYSSRGGNGLAGVGWSISGSSAISRCSATVAQDGFTASVQYSASRDRLCLNGQRLVVVRGTYGANGAEYRTELDQFARITQSGGINSGSSSFTVEYKDGMIGYYGTTANTRQRDAGRSQIMTWAKAYSVDRSGNSIHYDYSNHSEGEHLLDAIHYTGTNNTAGDRHVRFTYQTRPDPTSRYLAGGKSRQTKRLAQITTQYGATMVRRYTLNYGDVSESSQRSLLRSVQECAFKGSVTQCLPETEFEWQEKAQQFTFERLQFKNGGSNQEVHADKRWLHDVMPRGDVNGDGVRDWPGFYVNAEGERTGTHANAISNCHRRANSFATQCLEGDFNTDGRTDAFRRGGNGVLQIQYTGSSAWTNTGIIWPNSPDSYPIGFQDFNGDGWLDIAFRENALNTSGRLWIYPHTRNNTAPFNTNNRILVGDYPYDSASFAHLKEYQIHGDMDGNGFADFIEFDTRVGSGNVAQPPGLPEPKKIKKVIVNNSGAISFSEQVFTDPIQTPNFNASFFHDINGDGLSDWLAMANTNGRVHYKLNRGNGFSSTWQDLGLNLPVRVGSFTLRPGEPGELYIYPAMSKVLTMDYNSDGKPDWLVAQNTPIASSCHLIQQAPPSGPRWFCDEALYGQFISSQNSQHKAQINSTILDDSVRRYNAFTIVENDDGTFGVQQQPTDIKASGSQHAVIDATGDGLPDIVTVFGCRSPSPSNCQWNTQTTSQSGTRQDGSIVAGAYLNRNRGASNGSRYEAHDLLKSATTGLDVTSEWVYRPLSSDQYDRANSDFYRANHAAQMGDTDYFHFASSMYVVAEQKVSNGVGGLNSTKYRYRDAIYNNKGRGFQGFKAIIVEDDASGSDPNNLDGISRTDYYQKWPLSGISTQSCTWLANDAGGNYVNDNPSCSGVLSKSVTTEIQDVATAGGARFVAPKASIETRYKLVNRSLLSTNINSTTFDAAGNATQTSQIYEDAYTKVTSTTSRSIALNFTNWWLTKLNSQTVTTSPVQKRHATSPAIATGTDGTKTVTTTYNSYDNTRRLPTSVTTSANDSSLNATVTTQYTSKGLPRLVTTTGTNVTGPRAITTTYSKNGSSAAEDGYFVKSVTNALGHTSSMTTDPKVGQVLTQTDINGLTTVNTYDAFGRAETVNAPGVPITNIAYRWCVVNCPNNGKYKVTTAQAGSPDTITVRDQLNRGVLVGSRSFSTRKHNLVRSLYNNLGQMTFESIPYQASTFTATNSTGTRYNSYDALGRLTQKSVDQAAGIPFVTNYSHDGFKTTISATGDRIVDGSQVTTTLNLHRIYNGLEQLMEIKDANNGFTRYAYDGAGNPIALKDANGNQIDTRFNALGQKQYVNDPNMGRKDFTYNALGEVLTETDANGDTLAYTYDKLGRMTLRKVNGVNQGLWAYDNPAANKGLGLLDYEDSHVQSDGSRLIKSYTYTPASSGRKLPATVQHRIYDNATAFNDYTVQTDYDPTYSRPSNLTYPMGLEVGFDYNLHGYLIKERNAQTNEVYRHVTAMDARNLITQSRLASNQLIETVDYATQTGQMRGINVKKGNELRHSLSYLYDGFGNLHFRETQHGIDRAEERFEYDLLHRVTKSTRSYNPAVVIGSNPDEVVNYTFDSVGNLRSKSDYATDYLYTFKGAPEKPNAVKKVRLLTGDTVDFGYDDNGNMITGHNKTLAYNVFNKPTRIISGGSTSDFQYGADTMRYKKEESGTNAKTTIYIDKLMEVVTEGSTVKRKAYLGGTAVVTDTEENGSTTRATNYLLKGRLGSTITVTNENGDVVETNGFDPFGKPRTGLWQDKASNQLESQVTTRGYTGHEHLDESQLIHMNGRAYDYNLGRFLSVDPYIVKPERTQSLNPYSYVSNNPLSGVDPTGYQERTPELMMGVMQGIIFNDEQNAILAQAEAECDLCSGAANSGRVLGQSIKDISEARKAGATVTGAIIAAAAAAEARSQSEGGKKKKGKSKSNGAQSNQGAKTSKAESTSEIKSEASKNRITPQQRGRESEARILKEKGLKKSNRKVKTEEGTSILDAETDSEIIEIKDTKRVSRTKQMRIQQEVAKKEGKTHVTITGKNTKISKKQKDNSRIERRDDLGPPDDDKK